MAKKKTTKGTAAQKASGRGSKSKASKASKAGFNGSAKHDRVDEAEAADAERDERVLTYIRDGGEATAEDVASDLDLTDAEVRASAKRLVQAGKVSFDGEVLTAGEGDDAVEQEAAEDTLADLEDADAADDAADDADEVGHGAAGDADATDELADTEPAPSVDASAEQAATEPTEDARPKTRNLLCKLTKRDKRLKGEQVSRNFEQIETLEGEIERLSDDLKALKGKVAGLHLDNRRFMRAVREGREWRDVECREVPNFAKLTIETIRADTHEVLESRPMSPKERQGDLFGKSDGPTSVTISSGAKSVTFGNAAAQGAM